MLQEARTLLHERNVLRAVIIDDAFDEGPNPGDLKSDLWDRFFDDWSEDDEALVQKDFAFDNEAAEPSELQRDAGFVKVVWTQRALIPAAGALFEDYGRAKARKLADLEPLQALLSDDLGIECKTFGREFSSDILDAQILFLDLFLGFVEGEEAIKQAIERVTMVMAQRRKDPPIVFLLSQNPQLHEMGPRVRDDGKLLGCQFRMVRKADLKDRAAIAEQLYDLVKSHPDALKLTSFISAWEDAIDDTKTAFLKSVRTWDLADYANIHALRLQAEKEPVGDYALDLLDQHLHSKLEGVRPLVQAAKGLNAIAWSDYPPAQFVPSAEADDMMDGLVFYSQVRTEVEAAMDAGSSAVQLGDVFMAPPKVVRKKAGAAPAHPSPVRDVFVVLTQACDLQHGTTDQLLLMRGRARPYADLPLIKPTGISTPVMRVDTDIFSVDWDPLGPVTWSLKDVARKLKAGMRRVRRFRLPYALQLQQNFIGKLGRVGTMAELPKRYPVGVDIWLRQKSGQAKLLAHADAADGEAVCLAGRMPENVAMEWLILSPKLQRDFQSALLDIPQTDLPGGQIKLATVRNDPQFYRLLKRGIEVARSKSKPQKPFAGTVFDVIQTSTDVSPVQQNQIAATWHPLVLVIKWN